MTDDYSQPDFSAWDTPAITQDNVGKLFVVFEHLINDEIVGAGKTHTPVTKIINAANHGRITGQLEGMMLWALGTNDRITLSEIRTMLNAIQNGTTVIDSKSYNPTLAFLAKCSDAIETAFDIAVHDKPLPPGCTIGKGADCKLSQRDVAR